MKIGFIGAGDIAKAVGTQLAKAGHEVVVSNSRGPDSLAAIAAPLGLTAGTVEEAAEHEVVFLSVPWSKVPSALRAAGDLTDRHPHRHHEPAGGAHVRESRSGRSHVK